MKLLCIVFGTIIGAALAMAHQHGDANISIADAWSRAMPPVAKNGAAYLTLNNRGDAQDRLVGASSPIANRVQVHGHTIENGLMKMRELESLVLPPGEPVSLSPGGRHLMLIGLKTPLKAGDQFPVTLVFEHAPPLQISVTVRGMSSDAAMPATHGTHSGHGQPAAH